MATIMSHALAAGLFYRVLAPLKDKKTLRICLLGAVLPDFDVIAFRFGIPYEAMLGHRGFTHSILFALVFAAFCLLFYRGRPKKWRYFLLFFLSPMSHALLDMLTNGGLGVGLFIPFSSERFFFPFTPIEVSPIGAGFFSQRGLQVLISEFFLIGIPCLIIFLIHWFFSSRRQN